MHETHFDAIVVGSGFGGSVMAYRLAHAGLRVLVLERGKAWPPGSFPRSPHRMRELLWDPSRGLHGIFNVWSFAGLDALVGSGLGGGSLIYANVLIRKDERWFVREDAHGGGFEYWPVTRADLDPHYAEVERLIGVHEYPEHLVALTPKTRALRDAAARAGLAWQPAPLAVSFPPDGEAPGEPVRNAPPSLYDRLRTTCRLCGECDIGCNYGSKNTMDHTVLGAAKWRGAVIRSRCEVRSFGRERGAPGYWVTCVDHTAEDRDTANLPFENLTCGALVLCAGTLGSTYLMLRNRENLAAPSPALGTHFSGNGDMLGFALRARHAAKDGGARVLDPSFGPVITSAVRVPDAADGDGAAGRGFYVEDAGHAAFMGWLVEAAQPVGLIGRALRYAGLIAKKRLGFDHDTDLGAEIADLVGECDLSKGSLPMLGMGRDVPDGRMAINEAGWLDCDWRIGRSADYFDRLRACMRLLATHMNADYADNPLRSLGRLITVHPLGGCPMGRTIDEGVIDAHGEVFGNPGLFVADGAALPGAVGPNPSLTIAALAHRFADRVIERVTRA